MIIVDNDQDHLRAIVDTFHLYGVACLGIRYDPETGLTPSHFRAVRFLFLDLHLLATATYGGREHYAHLAQLLTDNISVDGGPFTLILWTNFDDQVDGLISYLDTTQELPAHARPAAIGRLAKDRFLDESERVGDHEALMREVDEALALAPQVSALFSWERGVQVAGRSTLASVVSLVPEEKRTSSEFPSAVDVALSRLAIAAVGKGNVAKDPRAAVNASLVPILADKVSSQHVAPDDDVWGNAVTATKVPPLPRTEAAIVNRMLHVALPESEKILASDWGAVVSLPLDWNDDDAMSMRFGLNGAELFSTHFKVPPGVQSQCSPKLVRIGAPCDYAQRRPGPIPYLLALVVPGDASSTGARPDAIWCSPPLSLDPGGSQRLLVSAMFPWTATREEARQWCVECRLREQLLMQLIHSVGTYGTRPGHIAVY
ncbi:MAG: hypothetical protein OXP36_02890 [Gammaproteobacteria bacterium]|nr:hypothetical protein [Gammaproteobacteria bacterium]